MSRIIADLQFALIICSIGAAINYFLVFIGKPSNLIFNLVLGGATSSSIAAYFTLLKYGKEKYLADVNG